MAKPRSFISSTCFDLADSRGVYPIGGDNLMVRNVSILEAKPA